MKPETAPVTMFKRSNRTRQNTNEQLRSRHIINNEELAERSRKRNMKPMITDSNKVLFKAEMVRDMKEHSVET